MANQKFKPTKPWIILLLFLIAWWVIPSVVKSFTEVSFFELQAPVWNLHSKVKDLQTYWTLRNHSKKDLIEASRDLARINASYQLTLSENTALREELERLETLLKLPKQPDFEYSLARVSRRDLSTWSHTLLIHKGLHEGMIEGAAVIYAHGVVGRIKKVYSHSSIVELVSSPTFRVAAHIVGDTRPITYQGIANAPFTTPHGQAYNIPTDIKTVPEKPLKLVSSKLGGAFPDGLAIGTLSKLSGSTDGLFQTAHIELANDLHNIQEVAVLLPLQQSITHEH